MPASRLLLGAVALALSAGLSACATSAPKPATVAAAPRADGTPIVIVAPGPDEEALAFVIARSAADANAGFNAILALHAMNAERLDMWGFRIAEEWRVQPLPAALETIGDPEALEEYRARTGGGEAYFLDATYLATEVENDDGRVYAAAELTARRRTDGMSEEN